MANNTEKTKAELYREKRKERLAKAAKKKAKKSMSSGAKKIIAVVVVVAIAAGIAGYAISSSGVKYRKQSVLSIGADIGDVSYAEFGFYYNSIFSNYFNYGYQYDSYYGAGMGAFYTGGFDYSVAPDAQEYEDELEGYENPTWADFFEVSAKEQIAQVKILAKLAAEKGITLDDEDKASIDKTMKEIKEGSANAGITVRRYLSSYYGKGVSTSLVRSIIEEQTLASKYQTAMEEEYEDAVTAEEIEKAYNEDTTSYDKVGVAFYKVEAKKEKTTDDDGKESSAVTDETMKEAKSAADKIAETKTYDDFKAAVDKQADKEDAVTEYKIVGMDSLSNVNSDMAKWLFSGKVEVGDKKVFEIKDTGYYVAYVLTTPYREDRKSVDVRHILVGLEKTDEDVKDLTIDSSLPALETLADNIYSTVTYDTARDKTNYAKAEFILRDFLNGDKTEESFAALATEKTGDTGSASTGGLYTEVNPGDMVDEFNDWCFDESRKTGDLGIVETTYGYHIMYFVAQGETAEWEHTIKHALAEEKLSEHVEEVTAEDKVPVEVLDADGVAQIVAATMKLAKAQIASLGARSSLY